jgi:hypothetical protein
MAHLLAVLLALMRHHVDDEYPSIRLARDRLRRAPSAERRRAGRARPRQGRARLVSSGSFSRSPARTSMFVVPSRRRVAVSSISGEASTATTRRTNGAIRAVSQPVPQPRSPTTHRSSKSRNAWSALRPNSSARSPSQVPAAWKRRHVNEFDAGQSRFRAVARPDNRGRAVELLTHYRPELLRPVIQTGLDPVEAARASARESPSRRQQAPSDGARPCSRSWRIAIARKRSAVALEERHETAARGVGQRWSRSKTEEGCCYHPYIRMEGCETPDTMSSRGRK